MPLAKTNRQLEGIFSNSPLDLQKIAEAACLYSRTCILKGVTQLESNFYEPVYKDTIHNLIMTMRELYCVDYHELSEEIDIAYHHFNHMIKIAKKFSIGNCDEMARIALDYVLLYAPSSVNAEIFEIEGGDHVFLVLGREQNSEVNNPSSWGMDAIICDPWANKAYPASKYSDELKNYVGRLQFKDGIHEMINSVEDFDPETHKLKPLHFLNSDSLRSRHLNNPENVILLLFQKRMKIVIESLIKLEKDLNNISRRLEDKYPNDPQKKELIKQLSEKLRLTIENVAADIDKDYSHAPVNILTNHFQTVFEKTKSSFQNDIILKKDEKKVLMQYDKSSYTTPLMRFFNIKPKSARDTFNALDKTYKKIQKVTNRP